MRSECIANAGGISNETISWLCCYLNDKTNNNGFTWINSIDKNTDSWVSSGRATPFTVTEFG